MRRHEVYQTIFKIPSDGKRRVAYGTVWQVLAMPHQKEAYMGIESETRSEHRAFQVLLDFNAQRRLASGRPRGLKATDDIEILRSLANIGSPSREPLSDPVFWMFRVWWAVRQTTLAFPDLQYGEELCRAFNLPERNAESVPEYKALAAWWCGRCGIQHGNGSLRHIISNRLQRPESWRSEPCPSGVPHHQASHWLLWFEATGAESRTQAFDNLRAAGLLDDWFSEVPARHMDQEYVS